VVVRAGDTSLHPNWTRDLVTRDWDLVVSYFGNDLERFRAPGEARIDDKGQKWSGLHALLTREDFWRGYDYIWPLWPRMLPPTPRSCAIIDALPMTHTRPVGGPNYDKLREAGLTAADEADALMMKYGIPLDSRAMIYLGVDREARILDAVDSAGKEALRRLLATDRAAFAQAVAQNIILDGSARSTNAR